MKNDGYTKKQIYRQYLLATKKILKNIPELVNDHKNNFDWENGKHTYDAVNSIGTVNDIIYSAYRVIKLINKSNRLTHRPKYYKGKVKKSKTIIK